jgi:GDP-mannose 6-dehydrogenase
MRISVFGLGYVGCVSAVCLADLGHSVIGVDVDPRKLDMLRRGEPPIVEPELDAMLARILDSGRLSVTDSAAAAIDASELSMVCVGTPSRGNGSLDTQYLERVIDQIGAALRNRSTYHVIAIRSTLIPGALQHRLLPQLEASIGRKAADGWGICVNPEFLREGSAIKDFQKPPFTLIGELDSRSGDVVAEAYAGIDAPVYRMAGEAASMVKYASNAYHALKVTFSNEIGALCNAFDINSRDVMDVFTRDTHLNVSAAYLRPGFAFGGSCLPKDVRALLYTARQHDVEVPLLASVLPSNDLHIQRVVELVRDFGSREVSLFGLSFKPGTDDLRESPLVRLAEALIGKGFRLAIHDPDVSLSSIFGRNRQYIETVLPHIGELLREDAREVVQHSKLGIVGKPVRGTHEAQLRAGLTTAHTIVDLTGRTNWSPAARVSIV